MAQGDRPVFPTENDQNRLGRSIYIIYQGLGLELVDDTVSPSLLQQEHLPVLCTV